MPPGPTPSSETDGTMDDHHHAARRLASAPTHDAPLVDAVWSAAAALGPADRSLLDLHLRHGVGPEDLAPDLGESPVASAKRLASLCDRLLELCSDALGERARSADVLSLFAAAPVIPAPAGARARVGANLLAVGVPALA